MSHRIRTFVVLAITMALLVPVTVAQKPPAPAPPPSTPPSRSATPSPPSSEPSQPRENLVMFLQGRVATNDGTPVPNNVMVERVCNNRVRQEVYASPHGDFSMQLGSRVDSFLDASGDRTSQYGVASKDSVMGIPRRELTNCELRASASGFHPSFANAWFQLGTVLQNENQKDAARKAYTQATTLDTRFLPPYLSLASMAYQTGNWTEVLNLTGHILDLDPLNRAAVTSYVLDLDPLNYADAYFYNAVANYKLNKIEDAEK